jgi:hypothetical protein
LLQVGLSDVFYDKTKQTVGQTGFRFSHLLPYPEVLADAAFYILSRDPKTCSGNFFVDDEVLASEGINDLTSYAIDPSVEPMPDFFI